MALILCLHIGFFYGNELVNLFLLLVLFEISVHGLQENLWCMQTNGKMQFIHGIVERNCIVGVVFLKQKEQKCEEGMNIVLFCTVCNCYWHVGNSLKKEET